MILYTVRHGQTDWNLNNLLQGNTDNSLNETGIKQAQNVEQNLSNIHFDLCYSSPLSRAYDTAKIICNGNVDIIIDNRLEERELGELEGKCVSLYDGKIYWDYSLNSDNSGVECVQDLLARVTSFYEGLRKKYNNETILIVAHGAIIRALHFIIMGYTNDTNFLEFDVPNCCVFKYEIEEKEV